MFKKGILLSIALLSTPVLAGTSTGDECKNVGKDVVFLSYSTEIRNSESSDAALQKRIDLINQTAKEAKFGPVEIIAADVNVSPSSAQAYLDVDMSLKIRYPSNTSALTALQQKANARQLSLSRHVTCE